MGTKTGTQLLKIFYSHPSPELDLLEFTPSCGKEE